MSVPCAGDVGPWIVADRIDDLRLPVRPDALYDEHVPDGILPRADPSPDEASMVGGSGRRERGNLGVVGKRYATCDEIRGRTAREQCGERNNQETSAEPSRGAVLTGGHDVGSHLLAPRSPRRCQLARMAPSPTTCRGPQIAGYAFAASELSSMNWSMASRKASARPTRGFLLIKSKVVVVILVAASESTAQCETSKARAPA